MTAASGSCEIAVVVEPLVDDRAERLLISWLNSKKPTSRIAYLSALRALATFVDAARGLNVTNELYVANPLGVAAGFLDSTSGEAFEVVGRFRDELVDREMAPKTIIRMVATVLSLLKHARQMGMLDWTIQLKLPKTSRVRDVRGPGVEHLATLQASLDEADDLLAVRDRAVFALLTDLGLRRSEVSGLDLEHFNREARTVSTLRKGEDEREIIPLADETIAALEPWLEARGDAPGPMFFRGSGHRLVRGARLSGQGIWHTLRRRSFRAGLAQVRPHGIRHTSISTVIESGESLAAAQQFSGHRQITSLNPYVEAQTDRRREMSAKVAAARRTAGRGVVPGGVVVEVSDVSVSRGVQHDGRKRSGETVRPEARGLP